MRYSTAKEGCYGIFIEYVSFKLDALVEFMALIIIDPSFWGDIFISVVLLNRDESRKIGGLIHSHVYVSQDKLKQGSLKTLLVYKT